MYTLDSTHGLRTTAHTLNLAMNILAQHLTDMRRDGWIEWLITGPANISTTGTIEISRSSTEEAQQVIAEVVQDTRASLTAATIKTTTH